MKFFVFIMSMAITGSVLFFALPESTFALNAESSTNQDLSKDPLFGDVFRSPEEIEKASRKGWRGWEVLQGQSGLPSGGAGAGDGVVSAVRSVMMWLLGIFGFLAVIAFVISGIMYLTSVGDTSRAETAKQYMIYSIIGVIVGLSGLIIVLFIDGVLRGRVF